MYTYTCKDLPDGFKLSGGTINGKIPITVPIPNRDEVMNKNTIIKEKTKRVKDILKGLYDKEDSEIMTVTNDNVLNLIFCIADNKFVIGGTNLDGDISVQEIPFKIAGQTDE